MADNLDLSNELQAAENWCKCLMDVFNKFTTQVECNRSRKGDLGTKFQTSELKTDYIVRLERLEQEINSEEPLTIRRILDINEACLRLYCFGDSWLEQRVVENEASIAELRKQLNEIEVLRRDEKWFRLVKELVAGNVFAWATEAITEILEGDNVGLAEMGRLSDANIGILIRIIKCLEFWTRKIWGYQIDKCQKICEVLVKVINKSYWPCIEGGDGRMSSIENELAECTANTLERIILQQKSNKYPKSAFTLINFLLDSLSGITKAECMEDNKNEDIAVNIYKVITAACEKHMGLMLTGITTTDPEHAEFYRRIVSEILQATTKPEPYNLEQSCSKVALHFWHSLAYQVYEKLTWEEKQACIEQIKPLYVQLTHIILNKAQHPDENVTKTWTTDDSWKFRKSRDIIENALKSFYDILQNTMLEILSSLLDEGIKELQTNPKSWIKLETSIFAFYSIGEYIYEVETDEVPKFMSALLEIPFEKLNDKLLETAVKAVQTHHAWLGLNPSYIPMAVHVLLKGLNSSVASEAMYSLRELCYNCQIQMKPHAEQILDACKASLSRLENLDAEYLTICIGKLMSVLPAEKIPIYMDIFANPCFEELQMICRAGQKNPTSKSKTVFKLKIISMLFRNLNTNVRDYDRNKQEADVVQPVLVELQKTMPVFKQTAEFWMDDDEVIDAVGFALCSALSNLETEFKPMLDNFCCFLISIFQKRPCPVVLHVSKECLRVLGQECTQRIRQLLSDIVLYTFQLFEKTPEDEISSIVKMIEAFRDWITHLIERWVDLLSEVNVDYTKLTSYVLKVVTLIEYPVRCTQFLEHLIMQSRKYANMTQAVLDQGKEIVRTVILCAVSLKTCRRDVEKFADVMTALHDQYLNEFICWMQIFYTVDFPTPLVSLQDKKKFMAEMVKADINKNQIRSHLVELVAKCRGVEMI